MSGQAGSYDVETVRGRLAAFLSARHGAPTRIEGLKRYTVGFSWLTYGFDAVWREGGAERRQGLVLRLGPADGLFGPYRASPEFLALQALRGRGIPVPEAHWHGDGNAPFGAPFLIVEKVPGEAPIPWTSDGGEPFTDAVRETLAEQFVAALAALHRIDWTGTPAEAALGRVSPEQAAAAQIDHWHGIVERARLRPLPVVAAAVAWLRERAPVAPRISLVHGDYRIGNFLEQGGRITAILDWEHAHLGDPVEDLAFVCIRAFRGRSPFMCRLIERPALIRRYQDLSGIPVDPAALHYWETFANFKLVAIHVAAAGSFEAGGHNDMRLPAMGAQIPRLALELEKLMEARP